MKTVTQVFICLLALFVLADIGTAQDRKAGLTGAPFLKVGVGARTTSMGSAATAFYQDVTQMFYNPAGMTLKDQTMQATFSYNRWIADISHNAAGVSYNLEDIGTIGVGFILFGLSDIPADRDKTTNPDLLPFVTDQGTSSTYNYTDLALQVSFGRYVMDRLALGITAKYISQTIDGEGASAIAFDFGSVYHIGVLDWTIAARFNNLGSDIKYYDIAFGLPLQFTIGTALAPYEDDMNKIYLAVDATKPQDGPLYFFSGLEYTLMKMVSVRGGYKFNYTGTDETPGFGKSAVNTTIEGFSAGAGFKTTLNDWAIGLDYSYTQMDLLDAAHRITLTIGMK
jgi:hypothetical protein